MGRGVAQQPFDLLAIIQQTLHDFLVAGLFAQARLIRQRLFDADRFDALHRDQLGQTVHLPVRHLQNAANVAHRSLGQKRTKGDDLSHLVAAIFFLDIADDFLAPVHAKVDIKVRHTDSFGVQKPLKQQGIAQRVKVGDGQRISHQRPRTGAAPRPHRNVMILGPFDEIGNDQEIPREAHALDDIQLKIEAFLVFLDRRRMGDHLEAFHQTGIGLFAQLLHLVIGKFGQDRIAAVTHKRAATRDFNRVFNSLRQVGKQRHHLGLRLEIVLRGQSAARLLLVDIGAVRDADQRIMALIHVRLGEIDVICGHQWQVHRIGHLDKAALRQSLGLGLSALARMALQLHIEPVLKGCGQTIH
mmetsp:Transcript_23472/g.41275  ORF Transcript_23472/g.41275 Transcript_23472/m.41275 type:complete len:357 (+) Transcript_23472:1523-2593(+)